MDKIVAFIKSGESVRIGDPVTLVVTPMLGYEYDPLKQTLIMWKQNMGEMPADLVGHPGKDLVILTDPENFEMWGNIPCYPFLDLLGDFNKEGLLLKINYMEMHTQSGRITSDTPNAQEVDKDGSDSK